MYVKYVFVEASDFADEKVCDAKYGHYKYQRMSKRVVIAVNTLLFAYVVSSLS
jgi:hypothetical protein